VDREEAMMGRQKGEKEKRKRNQQWAGDVAGVGIGKGRKGLVSKK